MLICRGGISFGFVASVGLFTPSFGSAFDGLSSWQSAKLRANGNSGEENGWNQPLDTLPTKPDWLLMSA